MADGREPRIPATPPVTRILGKFAKPACMPMPLCGRPLAVIRGVTDRLAARAVSWRKPSVSRVTGDAGRGG